MSRRLGPDPTLPTVITPRSARAAGLTADQVRHRLGAGHWSRVAWGSYRSEAAIPADLDRFARARLDHGHRALACALRNAGSIIGFESAAIVLGLPLASPVPELVTLIVPPGRWTGIRSGIRMRAGSNALRDLWDGGLRVTGANRTWLDLARTAPLADALAVGDAASARGELDVPQLQEELARLAGSRGCRQAARALEWVDGIRETPLESMSFAYFVSRGIALPECQVILRSGSGRFLGRVDFWWARARVVGECDGRLKYRSASDLYDEKRREDALREEGFSVVRWGMADLAGARLAGRLRGLVGP